MLKSYFSLQYFIPVGMFLLEKAESFLGKSSTWSDAVTLSQGRHTHIAGGAQKEGWFMKVSNMPAFLKTLICK